MLRKIYTTLFFTLSFCIALQAQTIKKPKYPSLFWEVTGNGLKKPSYLFGTMHVSSKMVFHLSDSFYIAMQNADMVALELNPQYWQRDMVKMEASKKAIGEYLQNNGNDYVNEKSFRLEKYDDNLKAALTEEPMQINGLLYRTYQTQADFEENTYLDLYIYQTGRKMGKKAAGVEDYYETQRIMVEAYRDMMKEKKKKRNNDNEPVFDIEKQIQDAYRKGNLDLLDSLQKHTFTSQAFMEKFLYKRNEIQANSMDTILHNHSLFAGVGAAHLPGPRGVIELLRKKGYKLRPIIMADRDADKKDAIDKLKVEAAFKETNTEDGFVKFKLPGNLYKRNDTRRSFNDSWQYADMDNGAYYMLTRVETHAAILGETAEDIKKKIDGLLYENIPGKIIKKTTIEKNGYTGFDITNRTRRGDMQRYNIFITPFEVLIFKMSGNDNYAEGKEADTFFNSIVIKNNARQPALFQTSSGGFSVSLPQQPDVIFDKSTSDRLESWKYEAVDTATGNGYMIWKKSVQNYRFLEEDTFDLGLMEESFKRCELIEKQTGRSFTKQNGYYALNMQFKLKNGNALFAKAVLRGAHYYLLITGSANKKFEPSAFFNSFSFTSFKYEAPALFTDTTLHFTVQTPVQPVLDAALMKMVKEATSDEFLNQVQDFYSYWPKDKYARFKSDSTGESVLVTVSKFPKYYYSKDSAKFWKNEIKEKQYAGMVIKTKQPFKIGDSISGYKLVITDTNTVRQLTTYLILKGDQLFRVIALSDTLSKESVFLQSFFNSFTPGEKSIGPSVFQNKLNVFFTDFYSKDSLTKKRAIEAIAHINFNCDDFKKMQGIINGLKYGDKDYFEIKSSFIKALGYMDDSACADKTVQYLSQLYDKTADTSYFQNKILQSLARLKTKSSYTLLKKLILQDPPIYEDDENYSSLFYALEDTLALSKTLFPDLLQLSSLQDYKQPVNSLLSTMIDSGYLSASDYEQYYSRIYFDAKIELKKQQNKEEKLLEKESRQDEDEDAITNYAEKYNSDTNIDDYSVLLIPFYDKNPAVNKYFEKLLQSKDLHARMSAAILLARNNKPVPDSIWLSLASKDEYRAKLLRNLEKIKKQHVFPQQYKKQDDVAKALLLNNKGLNKFGAIQLFGKEQVNTKATTGYVYFYKYKLKPEDDWKIGISGTQPLNTSEVSSNDELTKMTDKKLKNDEPVSGQFQEQLKKLLFSQHKSAIMFFNDSDYTNFMQGNFSSDNDDDDGE